MAVTIIMKFDSLKCVIGVAADFFHEPKITEGSLFAPVFSSKTPDLVGTKILNEK